MANHFAVVTAEVPGTDRLDMNIADETIASSACTIGLDVGGSKMTAGLVRFRSGEILAQKLVPTLAQRGGEAILADAPSPQPF